MPSQIDALQFIQPTTGIIRAIAPTVESQQPHQHSALPGNPLSPPTNDYIGVDEDFNDTPVCPDSSSQSGWHTSTGVLRNNHTLLHQMHHLDSTSSAWNIHHNNQATQQKSVVIPQLVTVYLANRAETESGRVPLSPRPPHQCKCDRVALEVKLINWDRKFSLHDYSCTHRTLTNSCIIRMPATYLVDL
jgi:hypothetical protein